MGDQDRIRWRTLRRGVLAARRDGRHLGTVERGRRWLAVDAESEPIGRFRTLGEAQAAVVRPGADRAPMRSSAAGPTVLAALVATASAASIAAAWPVLAELIR
ncbi:hypothetical protein [uncultured Amnibacterium sp.]|uniref:hypothetical protein n=1 Tax=uncultured Amnibacterium sp. TaxID=1631851 RepID=UPI0035CA30F6